jgi:hypothetical protein
MGIATTSEHARHAARSRWGSQVVTRAAEIVIERAPELPADLAAEVVEALAAGTDPVKLAAGSDR